MFGTLINLLTKRPDLVLDHLLAYSVLGRAEITRAKNQLVRRAVAGAVAFAFAVALIVHSGVALMLLASGQNYSTWVLLTVPGLMLAVVVVATMIALTRRTADEPESLGVQLQRDLQALRAALELRT